MNKKEIIFESTLNRIKTFIDKYDIAIISAFRNSNIFCAVENNYGKNHAFTKKENLLKHRELRSTLLKLRYGATNVVGSYIENLNTQIEKKVLENSIFVVNLKNDEDFINNIIRLGKLYCQDSVLIKTKGENPYLYGTNNSQYIGLDKRVEFSENKFYFGKEDSEYITKVGDRPFYVKENETPDNNMFEELKIETFEQYNISTKAMIDRDSKDNIKYLKK